MNPEDFNVFIYDLESDASNGDLPNIRRVNRRVISLGLEERTISSPAGDYDYRLEHYAEHEGCCLMNFVILRFSGPSRATRNQELHAFDLGTEGRFAYQTAALCDPEKKMAFIQSSRIGVGPGAIAKYLNRFAVENLSPIVWFTPRLDPEARRRAREQKEIRMVRIRAGTRVGRYPFSEADQTSGLGYITSLAREHDAGFMDLTLSFGPGKGSMSTRIKEFVSDMLRAKAEGEDVRRLEVKGRVHEDEQLEKINLLGHQEKDSRQLRVSSRQRSMIHEDRWRALRDIRREFYSRR